MSEDKTLKYYENNAQSFFERVHTWDMTALYDAFLPLVKGHTILELGCGTGRDAKFFSNKGFRVIAVDGSKEMIAMTQKESPTSDCRLIDFNEAFTIGEPLDAIWACASLLHLDDAGFVRTLRTVVQDLRAGGVIYIGLKKEEVNENPDDGRHFNYWTWEKLLPVAEACGLTALKHNYDVTPRITWMNAYFRK